MKSLSFALVVFCVSFQADALSIKIFTPKTIKNLIGPYPVQGSEAHIADFDTLRNYQNTRTEQECKEASLEESANLHTLFVHNNGPLTNSEAKRLTPRFLKIYAEVGANIYIAKKIYKRPRPYNFNREIVPCIDLEKSYAYPSGHTTMARVLAQLLGRIYPERKEAFMKRADQSATFRVLGGVHHPTDIVAGKKLGDAFVRSMYPQ